MVQVIKSGIDVIVGHLVPQSSLAYRVYAAQYARGTVYHKCQEKAEGYLDDLALIAQGVLYDPNEPHVLRPNGPVLLDAQYLVSILGGLYGRVDPEQALRVMKRELVELDVPQRKEAVTQ